MHTSRNKHPAQNSEQKREMTWNKMQSWTLSAERWTVCLKEETDTFISVPFRSLDVEGKNWLMIIGLLYEKKEEIIGRFEFCSRQKEKNESVCLSSIWPLSKFTILKHIELI